MFGFDTRVLRIVYTAAVCYLVYSLRGVLFLLLLAVVAAYMLLPVVEFAFRFITHKNRGRALAVVFLAILVVLLSVGGLIGYYAFEQASTLAQQVPALLEPGAIQRIQLPKFLHRWDHQIRNVVQSWRETHGKDILETLTSAAMQLLTAVGSALSLLIVLVLSYLLLRNAKSYTHAFLKFVPRGHEPQAAAFLADMHTMLLHWTRAIVLVALATVVLYGIGFSLLRVPYSILLAMIAFPFEFVPLIGPPVAFAVILGVVFFSGYTHFLWLILLFLIVRVLEDYVLSPYFMGSGGIELPAIIVIVGALAGEAIAGIPGLLFSVPAIATVRLLYRYLSQTRSEAALADA